MLSDLTNYLPEAALTVFDNLEFFIRIVLNDDRVSIAEVKF